MAKSTALITGASAGLGVHFAQALAERGHDLILTARRLDRLDELAATLRERHGVKVETIAGDLAAAGAAEALMAEIGRRGLAVNLLVNNAGFGAAGNFVDVDLATLERMLAVNCRALMELCHLVLPGMIQMRAGAILNVASTAAFQPGPGMGVYYASKAFVLSLTEALHSEVRRHNVHVSAICPGPTRTEFFEAAGVSPESPLAKMATDPRKVVDDGLRALEANAAVRVSGVGNKLLAGSVRFVPRATVRWALSRIQR